MHAEMWKGYNESCKRILESLPCGAFSPVLEDLVKYKTTH